jgi:hypothetical protein
MATKILPPSLSKQPCKKSRRYHENRIASINDATIAAADRRIGI